MGESGRPVLRALPGRKWLRSQVFRGIAKTIPVGIPSVGRLSFTLVVGVIVCCQFVVLDASLLACRHAGAVKGTREGHTSRAPEKGTRWGGAQGRGCTVGVREVGH